MIWLWYWRELWSCCFVLLQRVISNGQQIYSGPGLAQNEHPVHFGDGHDQSAHYRQVISTGRLNAIVQQDPGTIVFIRQQQPGPKQPPTEYPGLNGPVHPYRGPNEPASPYSSPTEPVDPGQNGSAQQRNADKRRASDSPANGEDARDVADLLRSESIQRATDERRTSASGNHTKTSVDSPGNGHAARDPTTSSYGASKDPNVAPMRDSTSNDPTANPAKSRASEGRASKDPTASPTTDPPSNNPVQSSTNNNLASDIPIKQLDSLSPISSPEKRNLKEPLTFMEVNRSVLIIVEIHYLLIWPGCAMICV